MNTSDRFWLFLAATFDRKALTNPLWFTATTLEHAGRKIDAFAEGRAVVIIDTSKMTNELPSWPEAEAL
jgi:hypothetical protein